MDGGRGGHEEAQMWIIVTHVPKQIYDGKRL